MGTQDTLGIQAKEDPALIKQAPLKKKNNLHPLLTRSSSQHLRDTVPLHLPQVRESHFNRFPKHVSDDKAPAAVKAQVHNTQPSD